MAAKKDIIKGLREEIRTLETKITGQRNALNSLQARYAMARAENRNAVNSVKRRVGMVTRKLREAISAELMWQELTDDPETQMASIRNCIRILEDVAVEEEEE